MNVKTSILLIGIVLALVSGAVCDAVAQNSDATNRNYELDRNIADCTKIIELRPDLAGAYLYRGDLELLKHDLNAALAD